MNWYSDDTLALTQTHKYSNTNLDQCFAKIGQGESLNIYESPNCSEKNSHLISKLKQDE